MTEFQGNHTNQACYQAGIISPEYHSLNMSIDNTSYVNYNIIEFQHVS